MTGQLYRAVWRWHFYAGLVIMPVLVILAVTGGLYLFKAEIHHALYRDMIEVAPRDQAPLPPSAVLASVESTLGGKVTQLTLPAENDRAVDALVRGADGTVRHAYADPYDARVLGSIAYGGAMETVRTLHSLAIAGPLGNAVVEIAAGWAIIMVFTGIYLWWPRGARGGVVTVRGTPRQRLFWRDLHAVAGIFAGVVIVFLAVTGMPWSLVWGDKVQTWTTAHNLGAPTPPAGVTPDYVLGVTGGDTGHGVHATGVETPWGLEKAAAPQSHGMGHDIGIDTAAARFAELGVPRPYGLQPPGSERGAYAATYRSGKVEDIRRVYLDRHTGDVIGDTSFADYGGAAKAIEWGIAVHQGEQYGEVNRFVMLAGCVAILVLAASSVTMWWKRRPQGKFGAPPRAGYAEVYVIGAMAVVGVLYPLTGLSFLAAVAIDTGVSRLHGGAHA